MPTRSSNHPHPPRLARFSQADLTTGSLVRMDGQRCAALSIDLVRSLHVTVVDQFGDAARDILYRSGFEWGLQEMLSFNQRMLDARNGDKSAIWKRDAKFVFASWWQPLMESGWGIATFDFSRLPRNIVVAELQHSIIAEALDSTDQPVCHWYAGLFAGGISFFERAERHATEIQCRALGQPSCTFVIGPGAAVDAAESSRQQGASATEIIRQLG